MARIGDNISQDLLLEHVLKRQPIINEELRRVLMHCAALEQPTKVSLNKIEIYVSLSVDLSVCLLELIPYNFVRICLLSWCSLT